MPAKALKAVADALRGSVRLSAEGVPNGFVRLTRQEKRAPEIIRSGEFLVSTGGFIREDSEPIFGIPITYRATLEIPAADRLIQTNRILNPKAQTDTSTWTVGGTRALARETSPALAPPRDATTSLRVGPGGVGANGITERTLLSTVPDGFGPGRWFFTGQVYYDSPDVWIWDDVKANGTWGALRTQGTWQAVRSHSAEAPGAPFATLHAAVLAPNGTVVVAPFQVLGVQATAGNEWHTFSAWVTVPAGAPAGSRLVLLQGNVQREYAMTWWLTTMMMTPEAEMDAGALPYFDGDTPLPANPAANMIPGYEWFAATKDASIVWAGLHGASRSVYTGPSFVYAVDTVTVLAPSREQLPKVRLPIYLSDPIVPALGQWFELTAIGPLSYKARADLYDVLGRGPQIAVSQKRAWPSGELRLMTYSLEAESITERLFASGRILYLRNPDPRFPENGWYLHIGDVASSRIGDQFGATPERVWSVPFVRVERPVGLIAASNTITWADIKAGYTWDELRYKREDWLDAALTLADT